MTELTVAAGAAEGLIALAETRGVSREVLLSQCGIDAGDLADPDNRIPVARYRALMRVAKDLSGDPALALRYGEAISCRDLTIVGLVGQRAATPMEALALVNRYAQLAIEVELEGADRFQVVGRGGAIWVVDTRLHPNDFPELTESVFARAVSEMRRMGMASPISSLHVTHPRPAHHAVYKEVFAAPVTFDADWNAIQIDAAAMTARIDPQPRYVAEMLIERADGLMRGLAASKSMTGRVEGLLAPLLASGEARVGAVAAAMGMSRQTLHRKLRAEGMNFERVLDDLRHRLALACLGPRKLSVAETAHLVGFSDRAAFSRAFKRWTGRSPGQMRARVDALRPARVAAIPPD
jgi:AraC-like DNA-binding protein